MIFSCDQRTTCPDLILNNLSAEDPDQIEYVAYGSNIYDPPLGEWWTVNTCFGRCVSHISQADAQACADLIAGLCTPGNPPNDNWPPTVYRYFYNDQQSATYSCPDGTPFTFVVTAGKFVGTSQAEADYKALTYAQEMAAKGRICLPALFICPCINQHFSQTIRATPFQSLSYFITAGSLPPGVTMVSSATGAKITGTPTSSGEYSFILTAVDSNGNYMQKGYTLRVIEITTTQLATYSIGSPYSFQLHATGSSIGFVWKIVAGALPPGLSMSSTGLITGTPTGNGTANIRFSATAIGCS